MAKGRNCKCRCCGKTLTPDNRYAVVVGKSNHYYCSEEEYNNMIAKKERENRKKKETTGMLIDAFGQYTTNTIFFKEQSNVVKVHGIDKLHNFMAHNKDDIAINVARKNFCSEYARIKYFFAIINNSIADWRIVENSGVKREYPFEVIENAKYKRKKKRKGFDFLDISDIVESED